jgi:hypothetical protein
MRKTSNAVVALLLIKSTQATIADPGYRSARVTAAVFAFGANASGNIKSA